MSQHAQDHLLAAHSLVANKNPNPSLPHLRLFPWHPASNVFLKIVREIEILGAQPV